MVGILVSFWDDLFSGAMLVSGSVSFFNIYWLCEVEPHLRTIQCIHRIQLTQ